MNRETIKRVLNYLGSYRRYLAFSLLLAAVSVALTLYVPIRVGQAIDTILGKGNVDFSALFFHLAVAGGCALCAALLQWLMAVINNKITYEVVRDIRSDAMKHIQKLPLSYLDSHAYGDIVSRVIADVDQFADGLLMGFTNLFTGVITILGTLVFMLLLDPLITLVVVLLTPLSLFVARFIANHTYEMFRAQSVTRGQQTAVIEEMIGNQRVVQAFAYEKKALAVFDEVNDRLAKCSLQATFYSSLVNPTTRFVNSTVYAAVALAGAFAAIGGSITIGGLSCFLSYAGQYAKPFNEISGVVAELQNALACAARMFDFLDSTAQTPDDPDAAVLQTVAGNVELSQVSFSYKPEQSLIENLNLQVEAGRRIAIVGPTGCGKTTLINLLMRFYDTVQGDIRIDGHSVRNVTRASLRKNFGMVLQETWLMQGTIRENIVMGKPDATEEEMIAAAKASHAHSFILRLPKGYDTVLSENGDELSQGQKQLLCITRVMLCLPPMLILDEATSSIDTRTEIKIQDAFSRMMKGRTSFIVAHRLSTIRDADRILVMKDGHIVEQGTHQELLEQNGFYKHLYESQFAPVASGQTR